ncbi:hypothetical protein RND71_035199 [Anisodus tanguticus]|uniref:Uncharacterized protein n=1 Tax=Anisodus tanguticus TaxID=243964 RepID=A0AAE1UUA1_9SOLA|nr:hypothetical protein RND71_035199 [Anisodus tanguticus]
MTISGIVYSLGVGSLKFFNAAIVLGAGTLAITRLLTIDHEYWHCYEGKPLLEFDRTRMFRSGLVGFSLHGSLSHYYYQFCEVMFVARVYFMIDQFDIFDES